MEMHWASLRERIRKLEDKFDVDVFKFLPVAENWKELFTRLSAIKKVVSRYSPDSVSEIQIVPEAIKVITWHQKEKIIKVRRTRDRTKRKIPKKKSKKTLEVKNGQPKKKEVRQ